MKAKVNSTKKTRVKAKVVALHSRQAVKRLVLYAGPGSNIAPVLVVEQMNPKGFIYLKPTDVLAVFKAERLSEDAKYCPETGLWRLSGQVTARGRKAVRS